jgi:predicted transglutaminase-like cysteine proteinase
MKYKTLIILIIILIIFFGSLIFINYNNDKKSFPDLDEDHVSDKVDAFPNDPAASVDTDGDGYPDYWNPGKDQRDSTTDPILELDDFKYDPNEWKDTDGDRIGDNSDEFPYNPEEWIDSDGDGIGDNGDINPNVDLEIYISLRKFQVTRFVDILPWAQVYFDVIINEEDNIRLNNNGNYWRTWIKKTQDITHEKITYNINDKTSNKFTEIKITMYDYDFIGNDDILDIDFGASKSIILKFDNEKNKIVYNEKTSGNNAILWFNISNRLSQKSDAQFYNINYRWNFKKTWMHTLDIPIDTYKLYESSIVNRIPQNQVNSEQKMAAYVTYDEKVIQDLADDLKSYAQSNVYSKAETINFILRFVQESISYNFDNVTKGCTEYWRFPIETLVEKEGDCEDTTVLFASLLKALDYDVVLLFYSWEEDGKRLGHLSAGVNIPGSHGDYIEDNGKKYYYCETTKINYYLGDIPKDIKFDPSKIIYIS